MPESKRERNTQTRNILTSDHGPALHSAMQRSFMHSFSPCGLEPESMHLTSGKVVPLAARQKTERLCNPTPDLKHPKHWQKERNK